MVLPLPAVQRRLHPPQVQPPELPLLTTPTSTNHTHLSTHVQLVLHIRGKSVLECCTLHFVMFSGHIILILQDVMIPFTPYTCTHMYAHVHTCMHMYMHVHTCTRMYTHVHACTHVHMYAHVRTCTHACIIHVHMIGTCTYN